MKANGSVVADILAKMKNQVTVLLMNFIGIALPFAAWREDPRSAAWELLIKVRAAHGRIHHVRLWVSPRSGSQNAGG